MTNPASTLELTPNTGFVFGLGKTLESLNATVVEIARTDIPVWIQGESGTGKEVYARLLHRLSVHTDLPLRKLSCSILDPVQLLRHFPKGSPADSEAQSPETVFLDGIDELDLACQRVLLSLLPDNQGQGKTAGGFIRLISSSSRNLEEDIEVGQFRKELYFRLNGVCLRLPPLRERKEDIPALVEFFLERHCRLLKKAIPSLDNEAMELFLFYNWPGNIRELENVVKKMVALGETRTAIADLRTALDRAQKSTGTGNERVLSLKTAARAALRKTERELISKALEHTHWNRKRAAQELQISYKSLLSKIKQAGLEKRDSDGL
jgi:two-component system response regulator AtoC